MQPYRLGTHVPAAGGHDRQRCVRRACA